MKPELDLISFGSLVSLTKVAKKTKEQKGALMQEVNIPAAVKHDTFSISNTYLRYKKT